MNYKLNTDKFFDMVASCTMDAIVWKAKYLMDMAGTDIHDRQEAINEISITLEKLPDQTTREHYLKRVAILGGEKKQDQSAMASDIKSKIKIRLKQQELKSMEDEEGPLKLPDDVSLSDYYADGMWYATRSANEFGCWFARGNGNNRERICKFVIDPLYATMNQDNLKLIMNVEDIENKYMVTMPIDGLINLDTFQREVFRQCRHFFHGTKQQLMRIGDKYRKQFRDVFELSTLGWQPEGFFAFFNKVYKPSRRKWDLLIEAQQLDYNDHGLVEIDGKHYYSPAISVINQNARSDDDFYKKDRMLAFYQGETSFSEWADVVHKVYPSCSWIIIGAVMIAIVRDIVFRMDQNCPLISFYGPAGSGKSKAAETMAAVFTPGLQPFNLNHGTDAAFFRKLAWARNIIGHFDEFDYKSMHEERLQSIKGAFDGVGRERMRKESRNATEIMEINCVLVLTGQYLCNWDDNSILSRAILKSFLPKGEDGYTSEELKAYDRLKMMEKKGLTGIMIECLEHREHIESNYHSRFSEVFAELRERVAGRGFKVEERIVRNYSAMFTVINLFSEKIKLPFKRADLLKWCVEDVCSLIDVKQTSDVLSSFWDKVAWLVENRRLVPGLQFKIKNENSVTVMVDRNTDEQKQFGQVGKRVLYIRLDSVHPEYLKACREQEAKNGIDKATLRTYFKSAKGYIGVARATKFRYKQPGSQDTHETVTSAYAFDYEALGISLETIFSFGDENPTNGNPPTFFDDLDNMN